MKTNDEYYTSNELNVIFEEGKYYYESIIANFRSLDTKGSILLALLAILLIPVLNDIRLSFNISNSCLGICAILDIIGLFLILLSLKLQELSVPPDLQHLQELYSQGMTADNLRAQLFANYKEASIENRNRVAKKAKKLIASYWLTFFSIMFYIIAKVIERLHNV